MSLALVPFAPYKTLKTRSTVGNAPLAAHFGVEFYFFLFWFDNCIFRSSAIGIRSREAASVGVGDGEAKPCLPTDI
jgi:hypothetical protein